MNICVIGGGGPKGRFGRDFCDRARLEGHNVYVLSHRHYFPRRPRHMHADFSTPNDVVKQFEQLTADIDHIDIFVYNSTPTTPTTPNYPAEFRSNSIVNPSEWHNTINIHAIVPHMLSVCALKKMSSASKIVFLVTGLSMNHDRDFYTELVGYATGKSAQIFLMLALANHNDRGAVATAISPHFDREDTKFYEWTVDQAYKYITKIDTAQNGKIKVLPGPNNHDKNTS